MLPQHRKKKKMGKETYFSVQSREQPHKKNDNSRTKRLSHIRLLNTVATKAAFLRSKSAHLCVAKAVYPTFGLSIKRLQQAQQRNFASLSVPF